jgi:lipoprotein-anchoring transpeptidase ErfK/SrfK
VTLSQAGRNSAIFMPGSCSIVHETKSMFDRSPLAGKGHFFGRWPEDRVKGSFYRLVLASIGAALVGGTAYAGPLTPMLDGLDGWGSARPVQYRDADVFFDGQGNRILMDRETGEIISVRPARPERRRPMRRPPPRDDGFAADDPDYGEYPVEPDFGEFDPPADEAFPPAPRQPQSTIARETPPSRSKAIERKPLPTPSAKPAPVEGKTATAAEPAARASDEPIFVQPKSGQPVQSTLPPATPEPAALPEPSAAGETALAEPAGGFEAESSPETTGVSPPATGLPAVAGAREDVAALQILLDRYGSSPGVIDGRFGSNVDRAIVAFRRITGKNLKSTDTALIKQLLAESGGDPFTTYTLTAEDVAGPYVAAVPEDYGEKAKLDKLTYTSVTEALAERFHMDEAYLKALNPEANFSRVGTIVHVANIGQNLAGKVARITADKANTQVLAYDAYNKLIAAYPASIGSSDTPSPVGTHEVSRIAFNPEYTYNPKLNFKQGNNDKILTIPPGPNGPVGTIWIALDKPTYGVHGTPEPSKIGKTQSHGCVRLTNWDANELAKMVTAGVTVEFLE